MLISSTFPLAVLLAPFALVFLSMSSHEVEVTPSGSLFINAVDIDVVSGEIDNYLVALKENGAASVKEPGCREFNILVSKQDPNHVFIFEVYDNAAAFSAHQQTEHFKKYAVIAKDLVAKREAKHLSSVAMYSKGM